MELYSLPLRAFAWIESFRKKKKKVVVVMNFYEHSDMCVRVEEEFPKKYKKGLPSGARV